MKPQLANIIFVILRGIAIALAVIGVLHRYLFDWLFYSSFFTGADNYFSRKVAKYGILSMFLSILVASVAAIFNLIFLK